MTNAFFDDKQYVGMFRTCGFFFTLAHYTIVLYIYILVNYCSMVMKRKVVYCKDEKNNYGHYLLALRYTY